MPSTAKHKITSCQTVKDRGLTLPKILPPGTTIRFHVTFKWMIDFPDCDLSEKLEGAPPPADMHMISKITASFAIGEKGFHLWPTDQMLLVVHSLLIRKQTLSQLPLLPPARPHLLTFPELPRVIRHGWSQTSEKSGGTSLTHCGWAISSGRKQHPMPLHPDENLSGFAPPRVVRKALLSPRLNHATLQVEAILCEEETWRVHSD